MPWKIVPVSTENVYHNDNECPRGKEISAADWRRARMDARCARSANRRRHAEGHLPVGAFRLPRAADLPVAAKFRDGQFALDRNSKGTEALAVVAVEADRRLQEPVALRALA